MSIQESRDKYV